jgi:hypothetical protein
MYKQVIGFLNLDTSIALLIKISTVHRVKSSNLIETGGEYWDQIRNCV